MGTLKYIVDWQIILKRRLKTILLLNNLGDEKIYIFYSSQTNSHDQILDDECIHRLIQMKSNKIKQYEINDIRIIREYL